MSKEVEVMSLTYNELVRLFEASVCDIVFTKADGSEREMTCTLNPFSEEMELIEEGHNNSSRESITVWDLEKKDWRSFRKNNLTKCNVITSIVEGPGRW